MKAIIWTKYGPPEVLKYGEVETPVPKDNEVLIRVQATTAFAGDCEVRALNFSSWLAIPFRLYFGLLKPSRIRILGQELAGEIEMTGRDVTLFKVGDPVYAATGLRLGAYAEYVCLPEKGALAIKPANMSFAEAAAVPIGGQEAWFFMRQGQIRPGDKVLIIGAGGSIGTFAVQLAKHFGAEVTAVDKAEKLEMLRSIGADRVIDYTKEDFTQKGESYDVIFDVVGKSPFSGSVQALKPGGRYLLGNAGAAQRVKARRANGRDGKRIIMGTASLTRADLDTLRELIEAGKLKTIIDRTYPLEQAAEAHRYVETGQKKGHVILSVV